jgi:hypothetical protein
LGAGNSIDVTFTLITTQTHWDGNTSYPPGITAHYHCRVFTRA